MAKRPPRKEHDKGEPGPVRPGNPPIAHRFKKGVSGNPNGRPKKERDMRRLIEAELDQVICITKGGKEVRLTKREYIARNLVNEAAKGDAKALQTMLKIVGSGSEPENPVVQVDPAELARFALRHLHQLAEPKNGSGDDEHEDPTPEPGQDQDQDQG